MSDLQGLLRVQEHDTAGDRLRHRRESLPELTRLAEVEDALAAIERALVDAASRRDDAARAEKKLEDELAAVEAKVAAIEARLYSGEVVVIRELQALQADTDSLRRRRSVLEDGVLEAMSVREPLDAEVRALEDERRRLDAEGATLRATIAEAQAALDAQLAGEERAKNDAAATLPPDLMALYERLRARHGGIGAAPLVNGRCGGCHLTLSATELDRLKREPADALLQCEQCGRVLVR